MSQLFSHGEPCCEDWRLWSEQGDLQGLWVLSCMHRVNKPHTYSRTHTHTHHAHHTEKATLLALIPPSIPPTNLQEDYYSRQPGQTPLPIRWMAPELIHVQDDALLAHGSTLSGNVWWVLCEPCPAATLCLTTAQ